MSCIDVIFEDKVSMDEEVKGLGFRLLRKELVSSDASGSCVGGEDNISPDTVRSVVGVVGIKDLKSKARVGSIVGSKRGWNVILTGYLEGWNRWWWKVTVLLVVVAPLADLREGSAQLEESVRTADLREMGVVDGSRLSLSELGDVVVWIELFRSKLPDAAERFDGEADLKDLWVGKLKDEGGAPHLGHITPDLLDLTLLCSPRLAGTPARLPLFPTVSTFAQPYSRGYAELQDSWQWQVSPDECVNLRVVYWCEDPKLRSDFEQIEKE